MIRKRRSAVVAPVVVAALAIGVTAAWAGFPNFRVATSTFVAGSATSGGATTSSRAALAVSEATRFAPATLYVRFSATHADPSSTFVPYVEGTQAWACANAHGGFSGSAVSGPVAALGRHLTLSSDANGRIVYHGDGLSIRLVPPASLTCSSGQTALIVRLSVSKLVIRVVGESHEQAVHFPTSAGWAGATYTRHGFPG